jgi:hypothetical protein
MKAPVSRGSEKSTSRTSRIARTVDAAPAPSASAWSPPQSSPWAVLPKHLTDWDLLTVIPSLTAVAIGTTGGISSW